MTDVTEKFYVVGGVHTSTDWDRKEFSSYEEHGPYLSHAAAMVVWKARVWANVDNALHKLEIVKRKA